MLIANGYFVWNPKDREPRYRHADAKAAVTEATRLAHAHPGQQFIVLKALGAAQVEQPAAFKWAPGCSLSSETELPF